MGNLNKESLHKNYKSQQEVDDQNLGMTVIFWIAAIIIASFFIISSIPWSTMDQFDILIGIVIVAFASAIIVGTVKGIRNNKHKDEALKRFNALSEFKATEYYLSKTSGSSIGFDNDRKKICFLDNHNRPYIYNYNKILQCEVVVDGQTILKQSTTGTLGRSILGGILGGGVGAIIGGTSASKTSKEKISNIELKVIVNDVSNPVFNIQFYNSTSILLKHERRNVERWHAIICGLIVQGNKEDITSIEKDSLDTVIVGNLSVADELKKMKELLDVGVLTIEEFNRQKTKLLR
jgi:hypothetical protein